LLLKRIGGNVLAFEPSLIEKLYDEYYRDVYHFSLYFTNNKQDAEDITQETFMKVMKNLHQLKDENKKKTWIISIAKNTAVDLMRKQKLRNILPQIIKGNQQLPVKMNHSRMIQQENWEDIQHALLKLKSHYRSIVILRVLKELSVKETADILGCNELKVRVDLHRALNKLRNELNIQDGWDYYEETR
jgi:RNA polymerase sigma-70 factor (ECF subfamily)